MPIPEASKSQCHEDSDRNQPPGKPQSLASADRPTCGHHDAYRGEPQDNQGQGRSLEAPAWFRGRHQRGRSVSTPPRSPEVRAPSASCVRSSNSEASNRPAPKCSLSSRPTASRSASEIRTSRCSVDSDPGPHPGSCLLVGRPVGRPMSRPPAPVTAAPTPGRQTAR